jgi:competence protein ComEC
VVTKFVKKTKSYVYKKSTGNAKHRMLIYGDAVDASNTLKNTRTKVKYGVVPNKEGWVKTTDLTSKGLLEIYFLDVGQGDSTFIVTPNRKKILVDGGENDLALEFFAWKYKLEQVTPENPIIIDLLIISHVDNDHIRGLIPIISSPKIKVKRIIHGGLISFAKGEYPKQLGESVKIGNTTYITTSHDKIEELEGLKLSYRFRRWRDAILDEGDVQYGAVDSRTGILDFDDPSIKLEVLGPKVDILSDGTVAYKWFSDHGHTSNGHSVVVRLTHDKIKLMLSGDLNIKGSENLLQDETLTKKMDSHILKAPHHGSHEFKLEWLKSVNPQISVISSGDQKDHAHPRANFLGANGLASRSDHPLLFSTEIEATFVETGQKVQKSINLSDERKKKLTKTDAKILKGLYLKKLNGLINVRTDGKQMFAARRYGGKDDWEMYSEITPSTRTRKCKEYE